MADANEILVASRAADNFVGTYYKLYDRQRHLLHVAIYRSLYCCGETGSKHNSTLDCAIFESGSSCTRITRQYYGMEMLS